MIFALNDLAPFRTTFRNHLAERRGHVTNGRPTRRHRQESQ